MCGICLNGKRSVAHAHVLATMRAVTFRRVFYGVCNSTVWGTMHILTDAGCSAFVFGVCNMLLIYMRYIVYIQTVTDFPAEVFEEGADASLASRLSAAWSCVCVQVVK